MKLIIDQREKGIATYTDEEILAALPDTPEATLEAVAECMAKIEEKPEPPLEEMIESAAEQVKETIKQCVDAVHLERKLLP